MTVQRLLCADNTVLRRCWLKPVVLFVQKTYKILKIENFLVRYFITASYDETIKVWNEWNQLIITIDLGLPIECISVISSGGDLALSFADSNELYFIKYQGQGPMDS